MRVTRKYLAMTFLLSAVPLIWSPLSVAAADSSFKPFSSVSEYKTDSIQNF